jgi:hypothetical protein
MASNAARTAPEQTGNGPQLSSLVAELQANIPNQVLSQEDNRASEITCEALRRVEVRARLGDLLEIVAVNAEAARLSLRIADDRGARYHFKEAWGSIQEADRGFAELRALSGSHGEPSR